MSMQPSIASDKHQIRAQVRAWRAALDSSEHQRLAAAFTEHLCALSKQLNAKKVACYLPVRNEPDTTGFILWAATENIDVYTPSCRDDKLLDWRLTTSTATIPGKYGIPEALADAESPLIANSFDLLLVPACAVSTDGTRLGWGGGFYDRTLGSMEQLPPTYAVVYDNEVFNSLPRAEHDIPISGAITQSGVLRFTRTHT